ncbi:MAG TPA: hypothetical protein VEV17_11130 [Bryobacteraceae bacterium]|nr:hypothetical protein [Bryobacteraceae bacterium]
MLWRKQPFQQRTGTASGRPEKDLPEAVHQGADVRRFQVEHAAGTNPVAHLAQKFPGVRDMLDEVDSCYGRKIAQLGRRLLDARSIRFHALPSGDLDRSLGHFNPDGNDSEFFLGCFQKETGVTADIQDALATPGREFQRCRQVREHVTAAPALSWRDEAAQLEIRMLKVAIIVVEYRLSPGATAWKIDPTPAGGAGEQL